MEKAIIFTLKMANFGIIRLPSIIVLATLTEQATAFISTMTMMVISTLALRLSTVKSTTSNLPWSIILNSRIPMALKVITMSKVKKSIMTGEKSDTWI